jgi:hypothetical protein
MPVSPARPEPSRETKEDLVSPADRSVRLGKMRTEHAISQACTRLAADAHARATFDELLSCVRARAPRLLFASWPDCRHPGVEALFQLARVECSYVRTIGSWPGSGQSWIAAVDSLAQHLLGRYRVPAFLSAAWYATDAYADSKRAWFIAHAAGASLRSLALPVRLTRRMEHILLGSPQHLSIEYALRRAELLGLGAERRLADLVLAARPALDFEHSEFWRTVWLFLIANARRIAEAQVAPIIDFIHGVRHERTLIETAHGMVAREPPLPGFSLAGRTPRTLLRLMEDWHRDLGQRAGELRWAPSPLRPLVVEIPSEDEAAPPVSWELRELTSGEQLRAEGAALRHCIASYSSSCWLGRSRIWSLRRRRGERVRSVLTVELDPRTRTVVQARGFRNRRPAAKEIQLLRAWAAQEGLELAL